MFLRSTTWLCLLLTVPAGAQTLNYVSPINHASWENRQDKYHCELSHEIPGFGTACFRRSAISGVSFDIRVQQATREGGEARLQAVPPPWQPRLTGQELGMVSYQPGTAPIHLGQETAGRMLTELERGMQISFTPRHWDAIPSLVSFELSTVNFRDALKNFRGCMAQLPSFDYERLSRSTLLFDTNSATLSAKAKGKLDRIVDYVLLDDSVSAVRVAGYADSVASARYNRKLSRRRAQAVRDYLLQKKLPARLIKLAAYGEDQPLASNLTETGRSRNRRVMVNVIK